MHKITVISYRVPTSTGKIEKPAEIREVFPVREF